MSFHDISCFPGALRPDDLALIQRVFDRMVGEPWVSKGPKTREDLGRYILEMDDRVFVSRKSCSTFAWRPRGTNFRNKTSVRALPEKLPGDSLHGCWSLEDMTAVVITRVF